MLYSGIESLQLARLVIKCLPHAKVGVRKSFYKFLIVIVNVRKS